MKIFEGEVVGIRVLRADMIPLVGRCCILPVLPPETPSEFWQLVRLRMFNKIHESPAVNRFFFTCTYQGPDDAYKGYIHNILRSHKIK